MGIKPWHIVIMVVGIGVLAGGIFVSSSPSDMPVLKHKVTMIDVVSGEVFVADTSGGRAVLMPAKHPDTGKYSLVRISKDDAGAWCVSERDRAFLYDLDQGVEIKSIEAKTGVILVDVPAKKRSYR